MTDHHRISDAEIAIVKKGHETLRIHGGIKTRCFNSNCDHYKDYGGRGITMCIGWRINPYSFLKDMGLRPSPAHSVGRIENDKGYWCGNCEECVSNHRKFNCRWETNADQMNNRRSSRFIEFNGVKLTIAQWERRMGLPPHSIHSRLGRGWSEEEAITIPNADPEKPIEWNGKTQNVSAWAREFGMKPNVLARRIKRKGSMERAMKVTAPSPRNRGFTMDGVTKTLRQWEKDSGIPYQTIYGRMRRGLDLKSSLNFT